MAYQAPKLNLDPKRRVEIPFIGSVGTLAHLGLVSGYIGYRYRIVQVKMIFTAEAMNLVRHYWLYDTTQSVSNASVSSGTNIFSREAPTAYFIGKGIIKKVYCNVEVPEGNTFIKLHTYNGLPNTYDINGSVIIEEI